MTHYERYRNDQIQVGILLTADFGRGWSSYNKHDMAFDKRLIAWLVQNNCVKDISETKSQVIFKSAAHYYSFQKYVESIYGEINFSKENSLIIEWHNKGEYVYINSWEGKEVVEVLDIPCYYERL